MLDSIGDLKDSIQEEYAETLDRIKAQPAPHQQLSLKVLHWLVHARRSLTSSELLEALAISEKDHSFRANRVPILQDVLNVCVGLVLLNESEATLELSDFTVKEYLLSVPDLFGHLPTPGQICLTYLNYTDFHIPPYGTATQVSSGIERMPIKASLSCAEYWNKFHFLDYCIHFWADHVLESGELSLETKLLTLLQSTNMITVLQMQTDLVSSMRLRGLLSLPHYPCCYSS